MAFAVPAHLPRRTDISTSILTAASEATPKTLSAAKAAEWVLELESAIRQTKSDVHKRIKDDLPNFERLLDASKSVQTRFENLLNTTSALDETLSHPATGLIPRTLLTLSAHNALAKQASDAQVLSDSLNYLSKLRAKSDDLRKLMSEGQLFEASEVLKAINNTIDAAPHSLGRADVVIDLKKKLLTADHRISEQLEGVLFSCTSISSSDLVIRPLVAVPNSEATISLAHVLVALPTSSLAGHLATLRRDLTTYFIDFLLAQPASLNISEDTAAGETTEQRAAVFPDPPNDEDPTKRLANMTSLLTFLNENLFPHIPEGHAASFKLSLCRPLTQALLTRLLEPLLPSDADSLPAYIRLIEKTVDLEEKFIGPVLGDNSSERPVASWAQGLVGHYERKRRVAFLEHARTVITAPEGGFGTFQVEITIRTETTVADVVKVEQVTSPTAAEGSSSAATGDDNDDDAWGLESESPNTLKISHSKGDIDEWGLDSHEETKPPSTGTPHQSTFSPRNAPSVMSASSSVSSLLDTDADEDAWGFDEGDTSSSPTTAPTEGSDRAEDKVPKADSEPTKSVEVHAPTATELDEKPPEDDDPWGDDPWAESADTSSAPALPQPEVKPAIEVSPVPAPAPKVAKGPAKKATRLERLANKGKSNVTSPVSSPIAATTHASNGFGALIDQHSGSSIQVTSTADAPRITAPKAPPAPVRTAPLVLHEHYTCSTRAKDIFDLVHSIIGESERLAQSDIFASFASASSSSTQPGAILAQSASAALDLYRALYPIAFAGLLKSSAGVGMKLGNDALWLYGELGKLKWVKDIEVLGEATAAFERAKEHMKMFADRAYEDCVRAQENAVEDVLGKADGFVNCGDQVCYDRCEEAISKSVRQIRSVAHSWKLVVNKTRYYASIGQLVETALNRVLGDILELDDITEEESRQLAELCRIISALEGLFVENTAQSADGNTGSFVVAYVPSWLKFSYISVLLEASMVDIQYLFDDGALVDFTGEELAKLVRALFADTPMRASMISRLMQGHASRA